MTPSYWLWDPSSLVFASFALFFAMIVADAGYALLLGLIVLAYRKRLGASAGGRRWRVMLSVMAGATAVYGALAGSYFGVSPSAGSLLGHLHVLDLGDFTVMMALSVIIGASHIALCQPDERLALPALAPAYSSTGLGLRYSGWHGVLGQFATGQPATGICRYGTDGPGLAWRSGILWLR